MLENLGVHGNLRKLEQVSLRKKQFLAMVRFCFVGAAGDEAVPTNGTAGAAGDTSRPYKWGLICRGGSITSHL